MSLVPYYDHAGITIYHARYEDVLPALAPASVDLLLADPNYGTTNLRWDVPWDWPGFWGLANRVCTQSAMQIFFSQQPMATDLINSNRAEWRYEEVWIKTMPQGFPNANRRPLRAHELLQLFCRAPGHSTYNPQMQPCPPRRVHSGTRTGSRAKHYGEMSSSDNRNIITDRYPTDVLYYSNGHGGKSKGHETAKPLDLLLWLVASYSNTGDLLLDPGMGRGTALWAAKQLGRRAIGIDARETCCERAVKGLQQEVLLLEDATA